MIPKKFKFLFLVGILFSILIGCSNQSESSGGGESKAIPSNLSIATLSQGSAWYIYGSTMSELIRENIDDVKGVDVLPYSGGVGNVMTVSEGEADLGFTFSVNNRWALDGELAYDKKYDNLRLLVGGLDQYYIGIILTDDFIKRHGVNSLADIKEKELPVRLLTITVGSQGEFAARQILDAYGMTYKDIESFGGSVEHTSFDVVKAAIQDNRADMFIQVMTKGHPAFTEIALQNAVTFMQIEDEFAQKLEALGNQRTLLPAGVFNGQDKEVPGVGFMTSLVVTDEFSEELAYEITKLLIEQKDKLAAGHQGLADFDPQLGLEPVVTGGIDIHPGAKRYYKELGWIK